MRARGSQEHARGEKFVDPAALEAEEAAADWAEARRAAQPQRLRAREARLRAEKPKRVALRRELAASGLGRPEAQEHLWKQKPHAGPPQHLTPPTQNT